MRRCCGTIRPPANVTTFATEAEGIKLRIQSFPAFDADGRLYVSDSYE
jgi:hypothetical protein